MSSIIHGFMLNCGCYEHFPCLLEKIKEPIHNCNYGIKRRTVSVQSVMMIHMFVGGMEIIKRPRVEQKALSGFYWLKTPPVPSVFPWQVPRYRLNGSRGKNVMLRPINSHLLTSDYHVAINHANTGRCQCLGKCRHLNKSISSISFNHSRTMSRSYLNWN